MSISAAIFGLSGPKLKQAEAAFFRDCNPFGFILFARNIETPAQVKRLCDDLREAVGRNAFIFIDQEGGRVRRLKPPHWRDYPPASVFGKLYKTNKKAGLRACWLNFRLIAQELAECGINSPCAPVLDLPVKNADVIISDRAFSNNADNMIALAHACIAGLTAGGTAPVIKHIPGHGRAECDSHKALPIIKTPARTLAETDFAPFAEFADTPFAMTAHVMMQDLDNEEPVTLSHFIINDVIRKTLGFDGLIMSDDIDMKALNGDLGDLANKSLKAGCDLVLQCSGKMIDMVKTANGLLAMDKTALQKSEITALAMQGFDDIDIMEAQDELGRLMNMAKGKSV